MKNKSKFLSALAALSLVAVLPSCSKKVTPSSTSTSSSTVVKDDDAYTYELKGDGSVEIVNSKNTNAVNLRIPDTLGGKKVTSIKTDAFKDSKKIKRLYIGDNLEYLDGSSFAGSSSLEFIEISKNNPYLFAKDNCVFLKDKDDQGRNLMLLGCKTSIIPTDIGTVAIGPHAFYDSNVVDLFVPGSVSYIYPDAFINNQMLKTVSVEASNIYYTAIDNALVYKNNGNGVLITMPLSQDIPTNANVKSIGQFAFYKASITSIKIPTNIGSFYEDNYSKNYAFSFSEIKTVEFLHTATNELSDIKTAFSNTNIEEFSSPMTLASLNANAFLNCTSLKTIKLFGNKIATIDRKAFLGCTSLERVILLKDNNYFKTVDNCLIRISDKSVVIGFGKNIAIPADATKIEPYAFSQIKGIESVLLNTTITSIGEHAFDNSEITDIFLNENITSIGEYAFANCKNLDSISIPNNANVTISNNLFDGSHLNELVIPSKVVKYTRKAFANMSVDKITLPAASTVFALDGNSLLTLNKDYLLKVFGKEDYTLPSSVSSIEPYAFSGSEIKNVTLSENIFRIEEGTFYNSKLENITLPNSLIFIGENAFSKTNLTQLNIPANVSTIENFIAYTPLSSLTIDANNNYYKIDGNAVVSKDGQTLVIGLSNSNIPNTVKRIDSYAFCGVNFVNTKLSLPDSVTEIGEYAFKDTNLVEVTLSKNVASVETGAFSDTKSLLGVTIKNPNMVLSSKGSDIASNVFENSAINGLVFEGTLDQFKAMFASKEVKAAPTDLKTAKLVNSDGTINRIILANLTY